MGEYGDNVDEEKQGTKKDSEKNQLHQAYISRKAVHFGDVFNDDFVILHTPLEFPLHLFIAYKSSLSENRGFGDGLQFVLQDLNENDSKHDERGEEVREGNVKAAASKCDHSLQGKEDLINWGLSIVYTGDKNSVWQI